MTRQTRIYGGYIQKLDVPRLSTQSPGNTTHNNRNMQRVELLVKLLYHLLTCHGQRITWLHESAVFVLIEQWIHIFWHQVLARHPSPCDFFLPWSLSQWEPQKAFPRSVHLPSTRLVSIYVSYIWFYHQIRKTSLNSRHFSNQKNQPLLGSIGHPKPSIYNYQHQVVKAQVHSDLVQVLPANRIRSGSHGQWLRIDTNLC